MTLTELACLYNFHDCDVFTPFNVDNNSITVTFDLAKHLQYDELKNRQGDLLQSKSHHLIASVKFSDYLNLRVIEWTIDGSKTTKKRRKRIEKTISIEQFDWEMDFISLAILGENEICFSFENYEKSKTVCEIQFLCDYIQVVQEKVIDDAEYARLLED